MPTLKARLRELLLWTQRYTRTDMLYLAKGGFWSSFNFVATSGLSVLLAIAFANLLPKETYGNYRYVLSIVGTFGFLSLSGMNTAVTRAVARGHDGALPTSIRLQLRWNLLFTLVLSAIGAYYALRGNLVLGLSLLTVGALTPPAWAYNTYVAFLSGKKDFRRAARYSVIGSIVYSTAMVVAIVLGRDLYWLVLTYAAANAIVNVAAYALTVAAYRPAAIDEAERLEMLSYGKHLSFINVLSVVAQQIDNLVVFKTVGPAALAVYAFANLMPDRLKKFAKSAMSVTVPKLSEKTFAEVMLSMRMRVLQAAAAGAAAAFAYILLVPYVFRYVFPQYLDSVLFSRLVALNLVFVLPLTYVAYVLQAQGMLRQLYASSVVVNVARILLFAFGGYAWGVLGVIAAKLAGTCFGVVFNLVVLYRAADEAKVASVPRIP